MKPTLKVSIGQHSDKGCKPVNQDFHGYQIPSEAQISSKGIAIALADGISSSQVSQLASQTSINNFLSDYYCTSESWSVKQSGQRILEAANSWLYAQTMNSPFRYNKERGYICTFSGLIFKSQNAYLFHAGDSRIYRLSGTSMEQLTEDHRYQVSENSGYLTRALGINPTIDLYYRSLAIEQDDVFILATDGVFEFVDGKAIARAIEQHGDDLDKAAEEIVAQALANGSDDNLTIQIARIDQLPEGQVDEVYQQAMTLPAPPQLGPRKEIDGYLIVRDIYISSRSHVYLAIDTDTDEQVILKTPSAEMRENKDYLEHFLLEEWIARRLDNAHILKAYNYQRKRNYLYMVTEYIEGQSLAQWMIDNPKPGFERVRDIIEQAAKGLQAFHRQEMVHQDLRPNNIMIDKSGTVKIIDFGSTRVAGITEIAGEDMAIKGTRQYTAPEYFIGEAGSHRSDIFSLGVIAYQMLTGKLPYGNSVSNALTKAAQNKLHYQPILPEDNRVPAWFEAAIQKAVQVNPYKRYSEVAEFSYELRHPGKEYRQRHPKPLMERDPVRFWQAISLILFIILIFQLVSG